MSFLPHMSPVNNWDMDAPMVSALCAIEFGIKLNFSDELVVKHNSDGRIDPRPIKLVETLDNCICKSRPSVTRTSEHCKVFNS